MQVMLSIDDGCVHEVQMIANAASDHSSLVAVVPPTLDDIAVDEFGAEIVNRTQGRGGMQCLNF